MVKKPPIRACPTCGSAELEWIGGGANAVFDFTGASGLSGLLHCPNCGKDILPIEFSSEQARKKFAAAIKKGGEKATASHAPEKREEKPGVNLAAGFLSTRLIVLTLMLIFASVILLIIALSQRSSNGLVCAAGLCGVTSLLIILTIASYLSARNRK